jgi:putative flippase GtrA
MLLFCSACSLGVALQLIVARSLLSHSLPWLMSTLIGIVAASLWNYTAAYIFVWQIRRRRASLPMVWRDPNASSVLYMEQHG